MCRAASTGQTRPERTVERIEAQVERFAPGFRDRILARHVLAPPDFAARNREPRRRRCRRRQHRARSTDLPPHPVALAVPHADSRPLHRQRLHLPRPRRPRHPRRCRRPLRPPRQPNASPPPVTHPAPIKSKGRSLHLLTPVLPATETDGAASSRSPAKRHGRPRQSIRARMAAEGSTKGITARANFARTECTSAMKAAR